MIDKCDEICYNMQNIKNTHGGVVAHENVRQVNNLGLLIWLALNNETHV